MSQRWSSREAATVCAAAGSSNPAAAIQQLAADLIDLADFAGPPFDPKRLASIRNVREVHRVQMSSAARLIPDGAYLRIEVNQDHSPGKQNFSIDHEITHTLIPTYANELVDDEETGTFQGSREEELLCDIGAAALLLDPRWLSRFAYQAGPSLALLYSTAEAFTASLEATARQLVAVAPWPAAFVFWEEGFRKEEQKPLPLGQLLLPVLPDLVLPQPQIRVKHRYPTRSFPHFIPLNKSVPATSLVAAVCEDVPQTFGLETFDFGKSTGLIDLYCENRNAPYRLGSTLQRRVISLLLPVDMHTGTPESFTAYELEAL
ncbi:MAG: ImmA/IrrE family metallo-endopeptidase [Thermomicrobiales bacterium]